jgi:CubicO group peptidase (beta-lactamase class C family)
MIFPTSEYARHSEVVVISLLIRLVSADATPEEVLSSVKYLKPSAAFKSHWQYNNIAFTIASHVPYQLLDGISFDAFVQEEIWNPLGMKHTFYDIELARTTNHMLSGVGRSLPSDRAGFRDVDACWKDIKRDGRLSTQCRGDAQDLGWFQKDWTGVAGAGGVITCSKDMASASHKHKPLYPYSFIFIPGRLAADTAIKRDMSWNRYSRHSFLDDSRCCSASHCR